MIFADINNNMEVVRNITQTVDVADIQGNAGEVASRWYLLFLAWNGEEVEGKLLPCIPGTTCGETPAPWYQRRWQYR